MIAAGIIYGALFHLGKKYMLKYHRPVLDIIFTLMRFTLLFAFFYSMSRFIDSNSILLIILFVSSYLGTVAVLTYKS